MKRLSTTLLVLHREETDEAAHEYHYIIDFNGTVAPGIAEADKGAHAVAFNGISVGIAFHGDFAQGDTAVHARPTPAQWAAGLKLCVELCHRYGLSEKEVKGHSELGPTGTRVPAKLIYDPDGSCPGLNFDLDLFRSDLAKALGGGLSS